MEKEREKFGTLSTEMVRTVVGERYVMTGAEAEGGGSVPPEDTGCEGFSALILEYCNKNKKIQKRFSS